MSEFVILVTFCCAKCPEKRELFIPFQNAEVFERALLECVPTQWTKIANGHFECHLHRPGHVVTSLAALTRPANTVRR
jgi:hypothetical protein